MWPKYELKLEKCTFVFDSEYGAHERGKVQDRFRLSIRDNDGTLLASESEQCGIVVWANGERFECAMPVQPDFSSFKNNVLSWEHEYEQPGIKVTFEYKKLDSECVQLVLRFHALKDIVSPHLSWGIKIASSDVINNYHWTQSPTQMSYSYKNPGLTLWMVNTQRKPIRRFSGCQALVAEHPDPESLEFHLRTPPGYADVTKHEHILKAGQWAELGCVLALRQGRFYEHRIKNKKIQPLEKHASRYPYKRYVDMAVNQFMDPKKYHAEHKGIMYYSAVDGTADKPQFQDWSEGPGWGGAWEVENAYNLLLYADEMALKPKQEQYTNHARKMLDSFLTNPKFHVPEGVHYKKKGDMDEAIRTTYWFPDVIWTAGQADFILRLSQIYSMTKWEDCLESARKIGQWVLRQQASDGTIPTLWQFPVEYSKKLIDMGWRSDFSFCSRKDHKAEVIVEYQPASSAFLVVALLKLYGIDKSEKWRNAAMKLLKITADHLEKDLAEFGNGELDYLVYRAKSMDPTGLSYIIMCMAEAYKLTKNPRYEKLLSRYTDTLLAYAVTFDFKETLLRPQSKITLGAYKTDIKLAGGITHANWRPIYGRGFGGRFNLLMNRNEMGDALLAAWQATHKKQYKEWAQAYANWQTYFQFLGEVENSPVRTKGSCPQNHFWTTDFGNWNNDYALTANKWVGTYLHLIKAGLKGI
ncbi:MAG: hypothetical protein A2Y07_06375 [Planctomycetes bacterium GWF2_50_10]|nr:MAG: hypothetical protein A2Y07_06375 [Planctomycetes bacterium GWF2_50_10]